MAAEVDSFKLPGFGGVNFPPPPFPLSSTPAGAPAPTTLATRLLVALAFPTPSPAPPPRSTAPSASDSDAFFTSFFDSHIPPRPSTRQIPASSPDPLSFASKRATPPPTAIYSPKHSSGSTSYTLEIPLPTKAQRKALEAQTRLTESQRARDGSTPGNLGDFASSSRDGGLKTLQEIIATRDVEALDSFATAQHHVLAHLSRADRTGTSEEVDVFTSTIYARDISHALTASTSLVAKFLLEELVETRDGRRAKAVHDRLESVASKSWSLESEDDVFGLTTDDNHHKIDKLAMQLSRAQPLAGLYHALLALLKRILDASESTQVGFRTKSLPGIGLVVAQDPTLFLRADVRNSIQHRTLDSCPYVRNAAFELV